MRAIFDDILRLLSASDVSLSSPCRALKRTADLAAAGDKKFLIKISSNIDSLRRDGAECLRSACKVIRAEPVIIGLRAHEKISNEAIYTRHGVMAMTPKAFSRYVDGDKLYSAERGGMKVIVRGIESKRHDLSMSRTELAQNLGVSVTMIRKYESGSNPSPQVARKLIELFGEEIIDAPKQTSFLSDYVELNRAPFDFAFRRSSVLLVSQNASRNRVETLNSFAEVLDAEPVVLEGDKKCTQMAELMGF